MSDGRYFTWQSLVRPLVGKQGHAHFFWNFWRCLSKLPRMSAGSEKLCYHSSHNFQLTSITIQVIIFNAPLPIYIRTIMHKHTHHSKGMRAVTAALLWSLAWRGRECGAAKDDLPAAGTSKGNSSALIFRQVYPWLHWALFLSCKANGKIWSARTTDETNDHLAVIGQKSLAWRGRELDDAAKDDLPELFVHFQFPGKLPLATLASLLLM